MAVRDERFIPPFAPFPSSDFFSQTELADLMSGPVPDPPPAAPGKKKLMRAEIERLRDQLTSQANVLFNLRQRHERQLDAERLKNIAADELVSAWRKRRAQLIEKGNIAAAAIYDHRLEAANLIGLERTKAILAAMDREAAGERDGEKVIGSIESFESTDTGIRTTGFMVTPNTIEFDMQISPEGSKHIREMLGLDAEPEAETPDEPDTAPEPQKIVFEYSNDLSTHHNSYVELASQVLEELFDLYVANKPLAMSEGAECVVLKKDADKVSFTIHLGKPTE